MVPANASERAQFEDQQDFISFDASPPPREPPAGAGATPGSARNPRKRRISERHGPQDSLATAAEDEEQFDQGRRRLRDRERARSTPWCEDPGVDWSAHRSAIDQLNAEARAFVHYISPTVIEHELRIHTIELIRRTIRSKYPDSTVECFGSVGTGLYLPGGDIDLVVLSPSMPAPPLKPTVSLLHRLASLLLASSIAAPQSLVVIAKARVPIVKFQTRYGGFAVDLSVNQKNGIDAAVNVRGLLEEYAFREEGYVEPGVEATKSASSGKRKEGKQTAKGGGKERQDAAMSIEQANGIVRQAVDHGVARSLVLLVKAFLGQRGMNEVFTGGLGSYSIICMVVSFLQLHPKIQTAQINPNRNLGLLFVEFLELYGKHFNYDAAGITIKARGGYFNKHDKGWFRPQQPYLLSIEDPNDPQNDVSGGSHAILRVRQTFAGGFDTLTSWLIVRQSLLAAEDNPSLVPLSSAALPNADSDPPSAGSQSLLGGIIGLNKRDLESREANERLYDEGLLQDLLHKTEGPDGVEVNMLGSKAQKRAYRKDRERAKREKTIARLERKVEDKEKRQEKKRARRQAKEAEEAAAAESGVKGVVVQPLARPGAIEDALAKEAALEGLAGQPSFVVDSVGQAATKGSRRPARTGEDDAEEDEGSRYSLGLPAIARGAGRSADSSRRGSPAAAAMGSGRYTHVTDNSSDSSEADAAHSESDGDVILGGGGGDLVRHDGVSKGGKRGSSRRGRGSSSGGSSSSGSSSGDVLATLVPAAERTKVAKAEAGDGAEKREASKAKAAKRAAYWSAKGPKTTSD